MKRLIGDALAARYFERPVHATSTAETYDDPEAPSLPVGELVERYRTTGRLPSKRSFVGGGRGDAIRAAYEQDSSLYEACRAHYQVTPAASMEFDGAMLLGSGKRRVLRATKAGTKAH